MLVIAATAVAVIKLAGTEGNAINDSITRHFIPVFEAIAKPDSTEPVETVLPAEVSETLPERYYEPEVLYELASQLNTAYGIYDDSMTNIEKAFRIFNWVHMNMQFSGTSDRTDWTCAAYDGLTTLKGDDYGYYAVCRAFLDMEGIANIPIERYPLDWSEHYWNLVCLNGVFYHCDALAFSEPNGYCFMYADGDFDSYEHQYDESLYDQIPIASDSVQQYVHYDTLEVDEF